MQGPPDLIGDLGRPQSILDIARASVIRAEGPGGLFYEITLDTAANAADLAAAIAAVPRKAAVRDAFHDGGGVVINFWHGA